MLAYYNVIIDTNCSMRGYIKYNFSEIINRTMLINEFLYYYRELQENKIKVIEHGTFANLCKLKIL